MDSKAAKTNFDKKFCYINRRVTNIINVLKSNEHPDSFELKSRLESLEKFYSYFENITTTLVDSITEYDLQDYSYQINNFENQYHKLKSKILSSYESVIKHKSALPELNIPYFGDPLKWVTFRDIFEAVVNSNTTLTDIVKFTYLQNSLKGEAKQSLDHIEISDAGYKRAWAELIQRFDPRFIVIEKHIDELIDLKPIQNATAMEMREFSNSVMSHVTALEASKMAFDKCSEIVVIKLVTRKLDKESIKDWEKQNSSKDPSWVQLREFLEKRCRVLESILN